VRHIGRRRARELVSRFGDGVIEAIDRDPAAALASIGLEAPALVRKGPLISRTASGMNGPPTPSF